MSQTRLKRSVAMFAITLLEIICATTINVYSQYGFLTEEIEANTMVITHGSQSFNFDIHMRVPRYDIGKNEACVARQIYQTTENSKDFNEMLSDINDDFYQVIKQDIETINNDETSTRIAEPVKNYRDLRRLMANLNQCGSLLKCLFDPVNVDRQPGTSGYTRYKNQIYPCFEDQAFKTGQCERVRPNAVCCYVQNSKNGGNCPIDELEKPTIRAQHYLDENPSVKVYFDGDFVPIRTIQQFCFVLNRATLSNGTILYENYTNDYTDSISTDPFWDVKRRSELGRGKRSTIWHRMRNQHDIDLSLEHVNILNSSISDLKNALEHPERKVASIYGDEQILQSSKEWLCNYLGAFDESNIIGSLYNQRAKLEDELERLDFECRTSVVPIVVSTEILMRFCRVVSDNSICIKDQVRELFSCESIGSSIQNEEIILRLKLKISIPIGDYFNSHKIYVIPRFISTETFTDHPNITDVAKPEQIVNKDRSDIVKLRELINEIASMRRKREIVNLHHNLVLNNIPDFAAEHSGDVLFFKESDCKRLREILVCPYAKNDHHASKCTVALMTANTQSVESLCEFSIQTTESNCEQIKTKFGYIVSSNEPVYITPMTNQKSVFVTEVLQTCEGICFIPREKEGLGFQCDGRNYFLEKTELNHTVTNRESQPLDLLKINDGRARLSDSLKTDFNPLNKFMNTHDIKQRDINMLTIMSGSVLGLAAFLFGTRRAVFGGQMIAAFAQK